MSGFWEVEGEELNTSGEFESGSGFEPIPQGTSVLAAPDEAKWDEYDGFGHIKIRWTVLQPTEFKNRKVFQKLHVNDDDPAKRDKAKRMLAAIDANAKGGLVKLKEAPSDMDLTKALVGKQMVLALGVWKLDDGKRGNWVMKVSPKGGVAASNASPVSLDDQVPF